MELCCGSLPVTLGLVGGVLALLYVLGKRRQRLLKDYGIPGPEPNIIFGSLLTLLKEGIDFENKRGKLYGDVYGLYIGGIPMITVADPDILKEILIKDFQTFMDRLGFNDLNDYPLITNVFNAQGATWKRLRKIISPTFSAGKLRKMCRGLNLCAKKLTKNFVRAAENGEVVDLKQYFGAFTMDAIGSTAFGIDIDSQNNFNNSFIRETKKVFDNAFLANPAIFLITLFPELTPVLKMFGMTALPKTTNKFFTQAIREMVKQRRSEPEEERARRVDFLELMLNAEDDDDHHGDTTEKADNTLTMDEVIGQAFVFFLAGYETTASTLHFIGYILATKPDVQDRLVEEVASVLGDKEPDYDNIHGLVYMDRVINETLRLYPVVPAVNRYVSKTTTIKGWTFPKGAFINIPIVIMHRNPDIYPEPQKFKPERFEKSSEINPMLYQPFGQGPRQCIGMRLALIEVKVALVYLIRNIRFVRLEDTPDELTEFVTTGVFAPKHPIKLRVELR
ncbi:cytochrome P450 3A29-like [Haliotis asinina]|uniref:cytochrome P450 3A29-like n=1 Tax=Haliotis asinina TaxID=109174 RepID=UPI0035322B9F